MATIRNLLGGLMALIWLSGCSTDDGERSYTFSSDQPLAISAAPLDRPTEGQPLGTTPLTVAAAQVAGKAIRFNAAGKIPQVWIFMDGSAEKIAADVRLSDAPTSGNGDGKKGGNAGIPNQSNINVRLALRAFEAVARGDLDTAKQLSTALGRVSPELAAPFMITGIALIKEGKGELAKRAFLQAKALDPSDTDIDKLLKSLE